MSVHDDSTKGSSSPDGPTRSTEPERPLPAAAPQAPSVMPAMLGPYRIVRLIGEGGMGAVYEAEQARPHRTVALKVIRAGLASKEMLARFEHEAEVLGRLQHPGIAQIFEAGVFTQAEGDGGPQRGPEGVGSRPGAPVPYFAMELIRGVPLTRFAEDRSLSTRDRLTLMARVCEAVNHAHQKGIIHRDLKPGNILVDERGQPKVLDFGVARLTESDIQTTTLRTDVGQLIGTVPYMSPEQASGDPGELDTRSDVYALGVVCYELLAGRLPYDLARKMIHEAVRVIREDEPTPLSSVDRVFRGDVETIVAKALEKDKVRRYQSALDLAADIGRYLRDEPIVARPAGTWYQAVKFSKRNPALVGGVVVSFGLLAAGLAATLWQAGVAGRERDKAEIERRKAVAAEKETSLRAAEVAKIADFQGRMLERLDPGDAGALLATDVVLRFDTLAEKDGLPETERTAFRSYWGRIAHTDVARELIERHILRPAVETIDREFADQPLVDASLRQVLADRYRQIGLYADAMPLQARALETRRKELAPDHPNVISSLIQMGTLFRVQGRLEETEPCWREAVERSRRALGGDDPLTMTAVNCLGGVLLDLGRLDEAEPLLRESLEQRRRTLGEDDPRTITSINNLGALLEDRGNIAEAEALYREAMDKGRRVQGENDPGVITSIGNVAYVLQKQRRYAEAEPYWREALALSRRVIGEDHPDTISSINNVAFVLQAQKKNAEAEPLFREVLEKRRRRLGQDDPKTVLAIGNLAYHLQLEGKLGEAEPLYREALEMTRRRVGDEHRETLYCINDLAYFMRGAGRFAEAEALLLPALAIADRTLSARDRFRIALVRTLSNVYTSWDTAEPGKGYGAKATEWAHKLAELSPNERPGVPPPP